MQWRCLSGVHEGRFPECVMGVEVASDDGIPSGSRMEIVRGS